MLPRLSRIKTALMISYSCHPLGTQSKPRNRRVGLEWIRKGQQSHQRRRPCCTRKWNSHAFAHDCGCFAGTCCCRFQYVATSSPAPASASTSPVSLKELINLPIPMIESNSSFHDVANNKMRKMIARRLTESKSQAPHFYTSMEIELDNIISLQKNLANNNGVKVSLNDFIIRSSVLALRDVPGVNATYDPNTNQVSSQSSIDISVAVATPTGLITPIVPSTDRLGLTEISDKARELAGRARDGKLQPHEYQGGTFRISNRPQADKLAVGGGTARVVSRPWVDGAEKQQSPQTRTIMTARLSADRSVVDEANNC